MLASGLSLLLPVLLGSDCAVCSSGCISAGVVGAAFAGAGWSAGSVSSLLALPQLAPAPAGPFQPFQAVAQALHLLAPAQARPFRPFQAVAQARPFQDWIC